MGVMSKPMMADIWFQCLSRMPGLQRQEMTLMFSVKVSMAAIVRAQILRGGGSWFGSESSRFILLYFDSPSRAACLNLDLNSFCS